MKIKAGRWWYLWPGHGYEFLRELKPTKAADIEDDLDEMEVEVVVQTENLIITYDSDGDLLIYVHESLLK